MTKRQLKRITLTVIGIYLMAILLMVGLRLYDSGPEWLIYSTYKDLIPLVIAIPAAYLAFSFQRRGSYVQALRAYWSLLVRTVQGAYSYTYQPQPSFEQYSKILNDLSVVIDEARGIFENLPVRGKPNGWYPFEPIREICQDLRSLGYGESATAEKLEALRGRIEIRWKLVRKELLREFDRDVPTHHYTWYTNLSVELQQPIAQQSFPAAPPASAATPNQQGRS
jgi:hypothetical protein